jgi:L-aminopeptidase/D-esterase-like protein
MLSEYAAVDALVFAGGSTYGLAAADGVMREIFKLRDGKTDFMNIPSVPAAVVYDFANRKNSALYPDADLGAKAFQNAVEGSLKIGKAGAGSNIRVGKFFSGTEAKASGQGAAMKSWDLPAGEPLKIFCFSVVNAVGNILDLQGRVLHGSEPHKRSMFEALDQKIKERTKSDVKNSGNTTLSLVVTNAELDRLELSRLGAMVHTSMARVIEPFHSSFDGDILFAVSTASLKNHSLHANELGIFASNVMWEAVHRAFVK